MQNITISNQDNYSDFYSELKNFKGTENYYVNPLFKKIHYTDGVKYFLQNAGNGAYWFLTLVATEILKTLKDDFYFIELKINADNSAKIIVQRDKGEPILYEKDIDYTDCPYSDKPYKFCIDVSSNIVILCLLNEY